MQFSVAELPLALFTTLAPLGAGAFIALACAFFTTSFSDEQLKKIDRGTIIPLAIVIVGFICAFFHLASPMNAPSVFLGAGSPMSNEIIAGCVFAIVAIVYVIVTNAGKICGSARKGFAAVVAVLAVIFAIFTGLAYVMSTIATWDTSLVPVQMLGFELVGGAATAALVLASAGAWADAADARTERGKKQRHVLDPAAQPLRHAAAPARPSSRRGIRTAALRGCLAALRGGSFLL